MFGYRINQVISALLAVGALAVLWPPSHGYLTHLRLILLVYSSLLILIISRFAEKNLQGQERYSRFGLLLLLTSLGIYLTFISTNLLLIGVGWSSSGVGAVLLVNHANDQRSRRAALRMATWFLFSDIFFWIALGLAHVRHINIFAPYSEVFSRSPAHITIALFIVISGTIRSGLIPAMRWLILTIEAPTPLSAFLHAGIVNGFGYLLIALPILHLVRPLVLVLGLVTITIALSIMPHRHDEKGKLANGTSMQMAFMAIEGVLGIPGLVLLHIVGHGSYKSWSFLRAGGAPLRRKMAIPLPRITERRAVSTAIFSLLYIAALCAAYLWLGESLLLNLSVASIALASSLIFSRYLAPAMMVRSVAFSFVAFFLYLTQVKAASLIFPHLWAPSAWTVISTSIALIAITSLLRIAPRVWTLRVASWSGRYSLSGKEMNRILSAFNRRDSTTADAAKIQNVIEVVATPFAAGMPLSQLVAQDSLVGLHHLDYQGAQGIAENYGISLYSSARSYLSWLESGLIDSEILKSVLTQHAPELGYADLVAETRRCAQVEKPRVTSHFGGVDARSAVVASANWWSSQAWYQGGSRSGAYEIWRSSTSQKERATLPISSLEALTHLLPALVERTFPGSIASDSRLITCMQRLISIDIAWFLYVKSLGDQALISLLALRAALLLSTELSLEQTPLAVAPHFDIWQIALENSFSRKLKGEISAKQVPKDLGVQSTSAIVTCIDVRSDILRQQVEQISGTRTFGMAGFFGIDLCVSGFKNGQDGTESYAPIILEPQLTLKDGRKKSFLWVLPTLWKHASSGSGALAVAEGFGLLNGALSALNTFAPKFSYRVNQRFSSPRWLDETGFDLSNLTRERKISYAMNIISILDLQNVNELIFVGHGADASNTPFRSTYECGACGGNNGFLNARTAAKLMSDPDIQHILIEKYGRSGGVEKRFYAAEHNTTLGSVTLDPHSIEDFNGSASERLKKIVGTISNIPKRELPLSEKMVPRSTASSYTSSAWWQVFPEWGLTGNAACVIGPRRLTEKIDLRSRVFLHDYNWEEDDDGQILASIFSGPGIVMQMINSAYNAAIANPQNFSSGDKTRHNVLGEAGVMLGPDGPLYRGLPWQSMGASPTHKLPDQSGHLPIRLQILVEAPVSKIEEALQQSSLASLVAGEWVVLHSLHEVKSLIS